MEFWKTELKWSKSISLCLYKNLEFFDKEGDTVVPGKLSHKLKEETRSG